MQDHYRARVLLLAVPALPRDGLPGGGLWWQFYDDDGDQAAGQGDLKQEFSIRTPEFKTF